MKIRQAKTEDIKTLAKIEKASYPVSECADEKSIYNRVKSFPDQFWILEIDSEIVSFINGICSDTPDLFDEMYDNTSLHDKDGKWQMIFSVVTASEHRSNGYASILMEQVIADCRSNGKNGIVLTCKEGLIPFYCRFGFENEGVSTSVHGGAVWYQMRLVFPE